MVEPLKNMIVWLQSHETVLWYLAGGSTVLAIVTAMALPTLLGFIPSDYYSRAGSGRGSWADYHPVTRVLLLTGKNVFGVVLVAMGILMLVLPGQGILTILVGIMLLNFPAKRRFERWIVSRPPVLRSINWLRRRNGRPPLVE